jgi:hypothetical protein
MSWFVLPPGKWSGMFDTSSADQDDEMPRISLAEYLVAAHGFILFKEATE